MTTEERNKLMEKIMKENNLDWQTIFLWITEKGYIIMTEEEYESLN